MSINNKSKASLEPSACTSHLHDMPWGNSANVMASIEITTKCNMACRYCQRRNLKGSHKSIRVIEREIATIDVLSKSDTIVLAGGEPLLHPELEIAVRMVRDAGKKPVILTNGLLVTRERLLALKMVGLFGIMFHINSRQNRAGWEDSSEFALNKLRLELAELANEFNFHCGFNTLVFPSTLTDVQQVALWASAYSPKVHMMAFIAARLFEATITRDDVDEPDVNRSGIFLSPYDVDCGAESDPMVLSSHDLYDQIQKVFPGYRFNSFLGSTAESGVLKWAMGTHLCRTGKRIGNLGPLAVRLLQTLGRKIAGRDVSHYSPGITRRGWMVLLIGLLDRETRKTFWRHVSTAFRKPFELFRTLHLQTFIVMQSIDILPDGKWGNCNGCSQKTTKQMDRYSQGSPMESYVLRGMANAEVSLEGNTQMQWPKQTLWRTAEIDRIGKEKN